MSDLGDEPVVRWPDVPGPLDRYYRGLDQGPGSQPGRPVRPGQPITGCSRLPRRPWQHLPDPLASPPARKLSEGDHQGPGLARARTGSSSSSSRAALPPARPPAIHGHFPSRFCHCPAGCATAPAALSVRRCAGRGTRSDCRQPAGKSRRGTGCRRYRPYPPESGPDLDMRRPQGRKGRVVVPDRAHRRVDAGRGPAGVRDGHAEPGVDPARQVGGDRPWRTAGPGPAARERADPGIAWPPAPVLTSGFRRLIRFCQPPPVA